MAALSLPSKQHFQQSHHLPGRFLKEWALCAPHLPLVGTVPGFPWTINIFIFRLPLLWSVILTFFCWDISIWIRIFASIIDFSYILHCSDFSQVYVGIFCEGIIRVDHSMTCVINWLKYLSSDNIVVNLLDLYVPKFYRVKVLYSGSLSHLFRQCWAHDPFWSLEVILVFPYRRKWKFWSGKFRTFIVITSQAIKEPY